mgnify:CR=1 FL=1
MNLFLSYMNPINDTKNHHTINHHARNENTDLTNTGVSKDCDAGAWSVKMPSSKLPLVLISIVKNSKRNIGATN